MITKFTILGERCSGTNFLENAIATNFNLQVTWDYGWKHFFGFHPYSNSDDTLFISIVRNPFDWLNSLYIKPYHMKIDQNIHHFLNNEVVSYYIEGGQLTTECIHDHHLKTGKRYRNLLELRHTKLAFQLIEMPHLVKHYMVLRYEDLKNNYNQILSSIQQQFQLIPRSPTFIPITGYKGSTLPYKAKKYKVIPPALIRNHPDFVYPLEHRFGYV